jgi:hypothetical protein
MPALEVGVSLGPDGSPRHVKGVLTGHLDPIARWIAEVDWWVQPVAREYWKVVIEDRLLCELFHDLLLDTWFLERVFD